MKRFAYQAIDPSGKRVEGVIEAESLETATHLLMQRDLIPSKIKAREKGARGSILQALQGQLNPVKTTDLILFTKQFRTMLRAGVAILPLLEVLDKQTENRKLKKAITSIAEGITQGSTLHDALRKHPDIFSPLYCSMVRAGEVSGTLPEILDRLVYLIEHEHKVKSDIKGALRYPIMVVVFLAIAFFVLLTFVIPKFVSIFESAGLDLPLPTVLCMLAYRFFAQAWHVILAGAAVLGLAMYRFFKTERGRFVRDTLMLHIPIIGPLHVKAAMSRFASIFALLQSSGIPVLDALDILTDTMGNAAISKEFDRIRTKLEEGRGISGPLRSARYFTPMVVNMVAIGEESGNLDEMLREVARHYDDEVAYAVARLSEAIGPILMVGLAAVVGFFALAIFLPMWDLTKMVK